MAILQQDFYQILSQKESDFLVRASEFQGVLDFGV